MPSVEDETHIAPDTPAGAGPLGSGGHGYNVATTNQLGPGDRTTAHTRAETEAAAKARGEDGHDAVVLNATPLRLGPGFFAILTLFLLVVAGIVVYGIHVRSVADTSLVQENKVTSVPEVKVTYPSGGTGSGSLVLPGNTQAFVDTPIYSRTNGYLQKWFFDIGAHVRKGQLMATIETPEVDQQLQVAEADLKASQANLDLANITSARYQNLLKSNSVSKQETDQAIGDAAAKQAAVEASMAAVRRLQQLQGFERIYAPFDGIVTQRNTDIGDLIQGGTSGAARALFRLDAIGELRVFVSVPEVYSGFVREGGTATLTADEYPGQEFTGTIARNANAIDPASRTLNVEVDIPNPTGKLLPGAYVEVHFKVPSAAANLTIPSNTLLFRAQGMQVGVVRGGKVQLIPVKIAQDHGATVEVASGLSKNDAIIVDPSDSLTNGQAVKIGSVEQPATADKAAGAKK
jgi:RND family efflux transporter MFP subunit